MADPEHKEVPAEPPVSVEAVAAEPPPVATPEPAPTEPPAPAPEAVPEPIETAPSLLEKHGKEEAKPAAEPEPTKVEAKPEEKPVEPAKPEEAKPEAEATPEPEKPAVVEPPSYAEIKLPEGLTRDEKLDAFTGLIGKSSMPVEAAEQLLGMHTDAMKAYAEHLGQEQHRVFAETRQNWVKEVLADSQIGGSGHQTAMGAIARMRDMFVAPTDVPKFEEFLRVTGAGDHPQFLKMLHNAARFYDEPPLPAPNPKPPSDLGGKKGRRAALYDHPTSGRQ